MRSHVMSFSKNILFLAALSSCMGVAYAGLNVSSPNTIHVYWGQNSFGKGDGELAQQRLSYYCDSPDVDAFQLSFVTTMNGVGGAPEVNFANQGDICEVFPGTNLLNCPEIGEDIKSCQKKGKTILLSIGGATYTEGGFKSKEEAVFGANMMWETFGPAKNSSRPRPFGDAVVDGFDLDFEAPVSNMIPFANRLTTLFKADSSKKYFLTAAPQCPYPDLNNKEMLEGGVKFDIVWPQFYNNFCGLNSFTSGSPDQTNFNFADWDNWAKNVSANPDVKIMVGAPANTGAAGSGYVDASQLAEIVQFCKGFDSFGGVMLWDATQGWANDGFMSAVKASLKGSVSRIMRRFFR